MSFFSFLSPMRDTCSPYQFSEFLSPEASVPSEVETEKLFRDQQVDFSNHLLSPVSGAQQVGLAKGQDAAPSRSNFQPFLFQTRSFETSR